MAEKLLKVTTNTNNPTLTKPCDMEWPWTWRHIWHTFKIWISYNIYIIIKYCWISLILKSYKEFSKITRNATGKKIIKNKKGQLQKSNKRTVERGKIDTPNTYIRKNTSLKESEWLLFNANWAIFSYYHKRTSYIVMRWWCTLCTRPTHQAGILYC